MRTEILYRFTIGKPLKLPEGAFTPYKFDEAPAIISLNDYFDTEDPFNSYIFTQHQIQFNVNMDSSSKINSSYVTLFNVDEEVINFVTTNHNNNLVCILEAGDNEQGLKEIFKGTITAAQKIDDTQDTQLKMNLADGSVNAKNAKTVRTYPRGTTYETILRDMNKDMKLPISSFAGVEGRLLNPVTFAGNTHQIMEKLSDTLGVSYSIQNGVTSIIPYRSYKKVEVSVITPTSGLLGNIQKSVDDSRSGQSSASMDSNSIQFMCLLDGALKPNETVYVDDGDIAGAYKITSIKFSGDYEGNDWTCSVKAAKVDGVLA
ncbi:baseplate hub [Vibrio phage PWH3a-P1]|uniref:baseplate hub n=1 Tax=Vibrio phage PWH3a-P1 TaxID=754058 RepID=UPI0002C0E269|nr:baseplate hub [Vibrio phage PWH3a-P1]AGH32059.1 hypothetical protein VPIG_00203 [Vibrio phage PWH3a-P1]